ncbi:hypothetical protein HDU78_010703 [Chytriomyces hyalinus]|nr:hypothetical protein BJ741DRAFT_709893 [Chytriomyces cf. hyalinus JEL632]KAJ3244597.1 hypothetical protein HDU78_010703 [Chytriomyces hyalinus]KAJ3401878.1 hypothetical protein HDU80_005630 [Chytriomyces hyalinus]
MVSIRSKKRKAARSVKRELVFKPVEVARMEKIAALLHAPKPDPIRPPKPEEEEDTAMDKDKDETTTPDEKLTKLQREEIMLSRNQFKRRQKARAVSKRRGGSGAAAKGVGVLKKKSTFKKR